jgi:hypothetical protein
MLGFISMQAVESQPIFRKKICRDVFLGGGGHFQRTARHYALQESTFHNHSCKNLKYAKLLEFGRVFWRK